MKKIIFALLLSVTTGAYAQKITIKTASGQTMEISCDGIVPAEIHVEGEKVTFKMNNAEVATEIQPQTSSNAADSTAVAEAKADSVNTDEVVAEASDSLLNKSELVEGNSPSLIGSLANGLAEELSPEYKAFNESHENDKPEEALTNLAKGLVGKDNYETLSFFGTLFSGLRFTKDSTFVATYEQRKPKPAWRAYNTVVLSGSFGRNIEGISDAAAEKVSEADYGDDTSNEHKFGGGIELSRVYLKGTEENGKWKPNPLGLALSWGGLVDYSYEKDMGSYFSIMAKAGVQIGHEIAIGVDGLLGGGVTPYNSFYTNGMNHSMVNKSAFCFKYGVKLWGSLNFFKDVYTVIEAQYIRSIKPSSAINDIPKGWEMIVEDFDPSSWSIRLGVGYKFGTPEQLESDKRLRASFGTGYQFAGSQTGMLLAAEIEHLTQVSHSTTLSYGLSVEELFDQKERYASILLSGGFKVQQPDSKWFWGTKLYGGIGDYAVGFTGTVDDFDLNNTAKKLCAKVALQLNGGFKIGRLSEIFGACRLGYHFGKPINVDGLDDVSYINRSGFEADARAGYRFTF